ncbi:excisionase family DNA binding protein [Micromonospora pisi]|uniref:Excisionase family DNA binding protein n=1 Tax=Micromonospora pisi TaxID=589240 RepID=A0A495JL23_9ACTN|nr:helix-turn-helix domain-containing protein [Micromonospora pisi]RKR89541.1 excisionase family DNA binding protein [Micromonospora pisi]
MDAPELVRTPLYRPAEVAKVLGCSEWWIREQARKRRIPFSWIGGSYRFTDGHLTEIIRLFEVRPTEAGPVSCEQAQEPRARVPRAVQSVTRLRARTPRRALGADQ